LSKTRQLASAGSIEREPSSSRSSEEHASLPDVTLEEELLAVHAVLERAHIANALCGGIAANLYREGVRATTDVDLYITCSAPELVALTRMFEASGWHAHPAWRKAELLRLTRDDHPPVDLLIASTEYERQAIERAVAFQIDDLQVRVLLPEDLIVFKLVAGRERDYGDVAAIINTQSADLDGNFVERTLNEFGMGDRWPRALAAATRETEDRG
jgi:predicted nucleotidyltransferase